MVTLRDRAVLIRVSTGGWSGAIVDKNVTKQVDEGHGTNGAGVYVKKLVERRHLKELLSARNSIKIFLHAETLPWMDQGIRVLPSKKYIRFAERMTALVSKHEEAVRLFCSKYDDIKKEASNRLGNMFDESEYPAAEEIKTTFSVKVSVMPIPENDFRIDGVDNETLRSEFSSLLDEQLKEMREDLRLRLIEGLATFIGRLTNDKIGVTEKAIERIEKVLSSANELNDVTEDKTLDAVVNTATSIVGNQNDTDEDKAKKLTTLLKKVESYKV